MNPISAFLTLSAILISLVTIGVLVMWLKGLTSILFPGLGFLVSTPLLALTLLILEGVILLLAMLASSRA